MTQNIYDDEDFFREYSRLPRSVAGLDAAPEWPALRALLPDLDGLTVVDLGCGFGWFCRWVREQGAASVLGIDASEKMLARAIAATGDPAMTYTRADMEWLELPPASFDLAYSSLALHYVEELDRLISVVYRSLAEGGNFVFSVEHPIFTAPSEPRWSTNSAGRKIWPVDSYLEEGPRRTDWLAKGVVKQHRTLGSYLNMLIRVGFAIRHVEEWGPTPEQIAAHPGWADERQRPPFLLIAAKKPGLDRRPHAVGARNQFHADNKQATGQSQARSCESGKYIAQYPAHADVRSAMPRAFGRDRSSQRRARRRINRFSPKMAAQSDLRSTISGRPFARAGPAVRISFPPALSHVRTRLPRSVGRLSRRPAAAG